MSAPGRPKGEHRSAQHQGSPASALPSLETARLTLREFTAADFDDLYRLDSDPRVVRFVGRGLPATREETAAALLRIRNYGRIHHGLGFFRAARRDNGAFIGWACLKYTPPTCDVEVGYRLLHAAWGHGYATELASALIRYGFGTLTLDRIIGVTHPDNLASQHVLAKAGLVDAGWGRYYGKRLRLFEATRAAWLAGAADRPPAAQSASRRAAPRARRPRPGR